MLIYILFILILIFYIYILINIIKKNNELINNNLNFKNIIK